MSTRRTKKIGGLVQELSGITDDRLTIVLAVAKYLSNRSEDASRWQAHLSHLLDLGLPAEARVPPAPSSKVVMTDARYEQLSQKIESWQQSHKDWRGNRYCFADILGIIADNVGCGVDKLAKEVGATIEELQDWSKLVALEHRIDSIESGEIKENFPPLLGE